MAQAKKLSPLELAWRESNNTINPFLTTEEDKKLVEYYRADFLRYAGRYIKLVDEDHDNQLVTFKLRRCQRVLHMVVEELMSKYGYVRALVPKARQVGVSTYVQARCHWRMRLWKGTDARLISNSTANAYKVFQMAQMFHLYLPDEIRPPLKENTKRAMVWGNKDEKTRFEYPGLLSRLEHSTAGNPHTGRGSHHHILHMTEVGLWTNSAEVLQAVEPSLHDKEPDTYGFLESTSAGQEGEFYERTMQMRDALSAGSKPEWYPVFLPAWLEEKYYDDLTDEEVVDIILSCDPYELGLIKKFKTLWLPVGWSSKEGDKLKPPHTIQDMMNQAKTIGTPAGLGFISWRRKKLQSLSGNKSSFDKEFSPTLDEFFAATGQTLFDKQSLLFYREKTISRDGAVGRLVVPVKKDGMKQKPVFVPDPLGPLTIWEHPNPTLFYGIGCDAAVGKKADPEVSDEEVREAAERDGADFCAAEVLDNRLRQVAEYNSNVIDAKSFGNEMYNLGMYYNWAHLMPETGNQSAGYAVLDQLMYLHYPTIGRWEKPDSTTHHKKMEAYGWEINDKAVGINEPVVTLNGWSTVGALKVGDVIAGREGWTRVTTVHDQGMKKMYRVTFSDGVSVDCSRGHRWGVTDRRFRNSVKTAVELLKLGLREEGKGWRWRVPLIEEPVKYLDRELPLDPYTLGMLIGNGSFVQHSPKFSSCDMALVEALKHPSGVSVKEITKNGDGLGRDWILTGDGHGGNSLIDELKKLGLWNHRSLEKFIPKDYLIAATKDRLALLQGLMDTDGHASTKGNGALYSTGSIQLAKDVQELVESLGGLSVIKPIPYKGWIYYKVSVNLPRTIMPFRLERKRKRIETFREKSEALPGASYTTRLVRSIVSIEEIEDAECRCIGVAAPDGLFAVSHYVLTHNTKQTLIADLQIEIMRGAGRTYTRTCVDEENWPKLVLRSLELLRQLQVFAYLAGGAIGARKGSHDDLVIALGLSYIALRQAGGPTNKTVTQEVVEYADDELEDEDTMSFWFV